MWRVPAAEHRLRTARSREPHPGSESYDYRVRKDHIALAEVFGDIGDVSADVLALEAAEDAAFLALDAADVRYISDAIPGRGEHEEFGFPLGEPDRLRFETHFTHARLPFSS